MKKEEPHITIFSSGPCLTEEQLFSYINGAMTPEQRHEVEFHLNDCELCTDALEGLKLVNNRPRMMSAINEVKHHVRTGGGDVGKSLTNTGKIRPLYYQWRWVAVAAILILVSSLFIYVNNRHSDTTFVAQELNPKIIPTDTTATIHENKIGKEAASFAETNEKEEEVLKKENAREKIGEGMINKQTEPVTTIRENEQTKTEVTNAGTVTIVTQNVTTTDAVANEAVTGNIPVPAEVQSSVMSWAPVLKSPARRATEEDNSQETKIRQQAQKPLAKKRVSKNTDLKPESLEKRKEETEEKANVASVAKETNSAVSFSYSDMDIKSNQVGVADTVLLISKPERIDKECAENDSIIKNEQHKEYEKVVWQKAECFLQRNKKEEAKKILKHLALRNTFYGHKAKQKLEELK